MGKIVFAEFGSMDFAEIAARNVRHKFEGISKIKIKYKHLDKDGYNDMEYVILPPSSFTNGSFGTGFPQSYTAVSYHVDREPSNLNQTMRLCGISSRFQLLSPCVRQVTHALLTRPPLSH